MHRVRAVRFSFSPGEEEEDGEDHLKESHDITAGALSDPETAREGDDESGRLGSQKRLAGKQRDQGIKEDGRKKRDYLCGLCSNKQSAVSVWNCDGEILPYNEISCR